MSDEFDDDSGITWSALAGPADRQSAQPLAPRLVARLYAAADQSLRSRMLACLLRPLGTLGLVAIASGAFASLLARVTPFGVTVALEDAARFSRDQVFELARFVEQVNPEALQQITGLFNDNPIGLAAFSAAALTLLARAVQPRRDAASRTSAANDGASGTNDRA
jgi:hypothetical protein